MHATIVLLVSLVSWCVVLYARAKPKHRKEKIPLVFFSGHRYWDTGISFPRAFLPLIECFHQRYMGFNTIAVRVTLTNSRQQILRCHMTPDRQKYPIIWDIGAGGYVPHGMTPYETAVMETSEELGFCIRGMNATSFVTYPTDGFNHIIFHYVIVKDDFHFNPESTDRTYTHTEWRPLQIILNYPAQYKHDPHAFVRKYLLPL
jgi:hypothetical protein